jgi:hypothetical protein
MSPRPPTLAPPTEELKGDDGDNETSHLDDREQGGLKRADLKTPTAGPQKEQTDSERSRCHYCLHATQSETAHGGLLRHPEAGAVT